MADAKHTPRPWLVNDPRHVISPELIDDNYQFVDSANGQLHISMVASIHDARLIAAAPELLETLQTIADVAVGEGDVCELIARRARAAIAKATGSAS